MHEFANTGRDLRKGYILYCTWSINCILKVDVKLYKIIWNGYGLLGEVFLFISTTGRRVFQTDRALVRVIAYYRCIIWKRNLRHFSPLYANSFALYTSSSIQYKDQSLVKWLYDFYFPLPVDFSTIRGHFKL